MKFSFCISKTKIRPIALVVFRTGCDNVYKELSVRYIAVFSLETATVTRDGGGDAAALL